MNPREGEGEDQDLLPKARLQYTISEEVRTINTRGGEKVDAELGDDADETMQIELVMMEMKWCGGMSGGGGLREAGRDSVALLRRGQGRYYQYRYTHYISMYICTYIWTTQRLKILAFHIVYTIIPCLPPSLPSPFLSPRPASSRAATCSSTPWRTTVEMTPPPSQPIPAPSSHACLKTPRSSDSCRSVILMVLTFIHVQICVQFRGPSISLANFCRGPSHHPIVSAAPSNTSPPFPAHRCASTPVCHRPSTSRSPLPGPRRPSPSPLHPSLLSSLSSSPPCRPRLRRPHNDRHPPPGHRYTTLNCHTFHMGGMDVADYNSTSP